MKTLSGHMYVALLVNVAVLSGWAGRKEAPWPALALACNNAQPSKLSEFRQILAIQLAKYHRLATCSPLTLLVS